MDQKPLHSSLNQQFDLAKKQCTHPHLLVWSTGWLALPQCGERRRYQTEERMECVELGIERRQERIAPSSILAGGRLHLLTPLGEGTWSQYGRGSSSPTRTGAERICKVDPTSLTPLYWEKYTLEPLEPNVQRNCACESIETQERGAEGTHLFCVALRKHSFTIDLIPSRFNDFFQLYWRYSEIIYLISTLWFRITDMPSRFSLQ